MILKAGSCSVLLDRLWEEETTMKTLKSLIASYWWQGSEGSFPDPRRTLMMSVLDVSVWSLADTLVSLGMWTNWAAARLLSQRPGVFEQCLCLQFSTIPNCLFLHGADVQGLKCFLSSESFLLLSWLFPCLHMFSASPCLVPWIWSACGLAFSLGMSANAFLVRRFFPLDFSDH